MTPRMISSSELISKIKLYHHNTDPELIADAYDFAKEHHKNQKRHSGEPYFTHPLAVAEILTNLKLDQESIAAALMHDVVEDTEASLEDIEKRFGREIADLVDGVTKLGQINSIPSSERVAENFRKLTMAMSKDIRVLIIKLADRYHNMQTISHVKSEEKKIRKAQESIDIYAPLAARIGLNKIKDELYDIAFQIINPDSRNKIIENLENLNQQNRNLVDKVINEIESLLKKNDIECHISGRRKTPYSIWSKMKRQNVGFYNLHDIMAFRIVAADIAECYKTLGVINSNYRMIPGTFKDYISTPKENGYQSIHLVTIGPYNQKIELQIRDQEIHDIAEYGVAAHWQYKELGSNRKPNIKNLKEHEQYRWIRDLISLFENSNKSSEVLKEQKLEIHKDEVFCFTPNGHIFNLPAGSCVIDFAYAIHSDIGNSCTSARVNGAIAPLRKKLNNGDQIEIITVKNAKPSPNWLNFVVTSKAKSAIRCFVRNEKFNEYLELGKAITSKFYASKNIKITDKDLTTIIDKFNKNSVDELYVAISQGMVSRYDLLKLTHPELHDADLPKKSKKSKLNTLKNHDDYNLPIDGLVNGMSIHYAGCCNPIPGDIIKGVINTGSGVTIHNVDCKTLKSLSLLPQRIVDVCWKEETYSEDTYPVKLKAVLENKSGSLAEISNILAKNQVNIENIRITNRTTDFFELMIIIEIQDSKHLKEVLSSLRISDSVIEIERISN